MGRRRGTESTHNRDDATTEQPGIRNFAHDRDAYTSKDSA
jgi:hypothetical protein